MKIEPVVIKIKRGTYAEADPPQPAPCEKGCTWWRHCADNWVGCESFQNYVATNVTGHPWPADGPRPNIRIGVAEDI